MPEPSTTRAALSRAVAHSLDYLDRLNDAPIAATVSPATLRTRLARPLGEEGTEPSMVIDDLVADCAGGLVGTASGRFFGWAIGGAVPAALAADWLTSAWDQQGALAACSPAAAVVEEVAGAWLLELLGLPATASFAFVTGCQMAHVTCLAAARHALLERRNWDVETRGLAGAPRIRILTSTERHGSIERAIRLLGLGTDAIEALPVDDRGRLEPATLARALTADRAAPTVVALQAGDLNIGAFDSFAELIPLARIAGAWVHVDGAFGLWAGASPSHRHLVTGVDQADSWATDGHKWLNVPFDCGYAFVADRSAHRAALGLRASYLTHATDGRDQLEWNPDWSRRARGFATYAALRQLGRAGVADLVERCCRHALALAEGIGALSGAELIWRPTLNQGLIRFRDPRPGATDDDHDRRTDQTVAAILATGEAFFTATTWRGRRCMRISVLNWRTDESDVRRAIEAIERVVTPTGPLRRGP